MHAYTPCPACSVGHLVRTMPLGIHPRGVVVDGYLESQLSVILTEYALSRTKQYNGWTTLRARGVVCVGRSLDWLRSSRAATASTCGISEFRRRG